MKRDEYCGIDRSSKLAVLYTLGAGVVLAGGVHLGQVIKGERDLFEVPRNSVRAQIRDINSYYEGLR
jgi:hypothetical protein